MANGPEYETGDLLNITQCQHIFKDYIDCGRTVFYREYRPMIKFKNISSHPNRKRLRIPYRIAVGLIHVLLDQHDERRDPPYYQIRKYLKKPLELEHQRA